MDDAKGVFEDYARELRLEYYQKLLAQQAALTSPSSDQPSRREMEPKR